MIKNPPYIESFLNQETRFAAGVVEKLENNPYVLACYLNWDKLGHSERAEFATYYARVIGSYFGRTNPLLSTFEKPNIRDASGRVQTLFGYYKKNGEFGPTLMINTHPDALVDLKSMCSVITHEETHDRQELIKKNPARWKAEPPIVEILKWEDAHYINGETDFDSYERQLCEQHAFAMDESITNALFARLENKKSIILDPIEDKKIQEEYERGSVRLGHDNTVPNTDPRRYYYAAKLIQNRLALNHGSHDFIEMIRCYDLSLKYGEYATLPKNDIVRALYDIAVNSVDSDYRGSVPDIYRNSALGVLEKYQTHDSYLGRVAKIYVQRIEKVNQLRADRATGNKPGQPQRVPLNKKPLDLSPT